MVGDGQVVVDGLGAADELLLRAGQQGIVKQLADGVHGIVAADVDEHFDVQLIQQFENALIDRLVLMDFGQLVAAGAQEGGRGAFEQFQVQFILDMLGQVHILLIHEALDAVAHTVNLVVAAFFGCLEHAREAGVDDGRGAAGLTDKYVTLHDVASFLFSYISIDHRKMNNVLTFVRQTVAGRDRETALVK